MARHTETSKCPEGNNGFTLIELIVTVAILGLLATIAIPVFGNLLKRTKTTEVKACLGELRVLEEGYRFGAHTYIGCPPMKIIPAGLHENKGPHEDNMAEIGFYPKGYARYTYSIDYADSNTFTASGEGNLDGDSDTDRWTVSETGILLHTEID